MKQSILFAAVLASLGTARAQVPLLGIPTGIPAAVSLPVEAPILFDSGGAQISTILFSVDFDEECLAFDPTDADLDGLPDTIVFDLPPQFVGTVNFNGEDEDGELDFTIVDLLPPLAALPDGFLVTMTFVPICEPVGVAIIAPVLFSTDPPVSFGGTTGLGVPGTSLGGSIQIDSPIFIDGFESGDMSAWSGVVP